MRQLNQDKTEIIICNPKKFDIPINNIQCGDETICFSNSGKNLGVILDDKLSMSEHILSISRSIYCEIRRMKQISNFVSSECSLKKIASHSYFHALIIAILFLSICLRKIFINYKNYKTMQLEQF